MKQVASCYVRHGEMVLAVFNPKFSVWLLPGGKVERSESPIEAASRELYEETGLSALALAPIYAAPSSYDPTFMVSVFLVQTDDRQRPFTREPGNLVAWVTPNQLCNSRLFGPFYERFFEKIGVLV